MTKRRLLAIANPISGRGRALKLLPRLELLAERAGVEVEPRMTEHAGHGREIAAAAAGDGFDAVIGIGGDGTLNEVVNGLGVGGLPLMIVPLGTANVLAKEIGAPRDPARNVEALRDWRLLTRDLGRTGEGRLFTCFVGAGFDGECTRALKERTGAIRMSSYGPIILRAIRTADYRTLRVVAGDQVVREGASWALASLTPCYGGPLAFTPDADPTDGKIDVLTLTRRISPMSVVGMLARGFLRLFRGARTAEFKQVVEFSITSAEPNNGKVPYQIDGDFAGYLPVEAEVIPGGLTLLV